ncbi:hypothetical protein ABT025_30355, partial [Streptomyces sp. NPDC002809]
KENARNFLKDNPDLADEIEKKILEKLGVGVRPDTGAEQRPGNAQNTEEGRLTVPTPTLGLSAAAPGVTSVTDGSGRGSGPVDPHAAG